MSIFTDNRFDQNLFDHEIANLHDYEKNSLNSMRYGQSSADGSAIIGRDNHIFIQGGSNRWSQQITGNAVIADVDFDRTRRVIDSYTTECHNRGIDLSIIIIPEKDVIYPEYSPNCHDIILQDRTIHKIMNEYPSVHYPWENIIRHKHCGLTYHRLDSHYNTFGGFIVFNAVLDSLNISNVSWDDIYFAHREWQDDLSIKWFAKKFTRRTLLENYRETSIAQGNPLTGTHIKFESNIARNDDTIVVFGDSYSWNPDAGLSRFLLYRFKTVHFIWNRNINWSFVDRVKPKAIVVQSAERFLIGGLVRS